MAEQSVPGSVYLFSVLTILLFFWILSLRVQGCFLIPPLKRSIGIDFPSIGLRFAIGVWNNGHAQLVFEPLHILINQCHCRFFMVFSFLFLW